MLEVLSSIKNGYIYSAVMVALVSKCLSIVPMCYDVYRTEYSQNISYITIALNFITAFFSLTVCIILSLYFQTFLFLILLVSTIFLFLIKNEFEKDDKPINKKENFSLKKSILNLTWNDIKKIFNPKLNGLIPN